MAAARCQLGGPRAAEGDAVGLGRTRRGAVGDGSFSRRLHAGRLRGGDSRLLLRVKTAVSSCSSNDGIRGRVMNATQLTDTFGLSDASLMEEENEDDGMEVSTVSRNVSASLREGSSKHGSIVNAKERLKFTNGKLLSDVCTWGIGGPAKYFIEVHTEEEMTQALRYCNQNHIRIFILGKGSNCLFDDRGYDGCVILNKIDFMESDSEGKFKVGSGYPFNQLGVLSSKSGFSGLEFACGIPGTVGGAVYMNAGADQQETADTLQSVDVVSLEGERRTLLRSRGELPYGYRHSPFQVMSGHTVITAATFQLTPWSGARERQMMYMNRRRKSQPVLDKSAGCVFRNPGNGLPSAGAVIDQLGLKGHSVGGASVSEVHANFLVNRAGARSADMLALISDIKARARGERGIDLQEEIFYVPYSD